MRLFFLLSAAAVIAVLALAACNSTETRGNKSAAGNGNGVRVTSTTTTVTTPTQPQQHADGARRVTVAELREALDRGKALVVDVRGADAYRQSRIKGSIHMPTEEIANRLGELPRDKMIVTYCS